MIKKFGFGFFIFILLSVQISAYELQIPLEGEWKYMREDDTQFSLPEYDDSMWPSVNLPSRKLMPSDTAEISGESKEKRTDAREGYVWYRKKIHFKSIPEFPLLFQVREIMNADEVYLNGKLIGTSGRFPPEFHSAWGLFRSYSILPGDIVQGENVIAMRVYFNAEAWIISPIRIVDSQSGITEKIFHDFFLIHVMLGFSFLLVTIFVFFISFYRSRKKEIEYLYFAFTSLSIGVCIGLSYIENIYPDIPVSSNIILKLTQTGLLFFPAFQSLFAVQYLFGYVKKIRIILSLLFPLVGTVLMIFAQTRQEIFLYRNIFISGFLIFFLDGIIYYIRNRSRQHVKSNLFVYGLGFLILLGLHDVLSFGFNLFGSTISLFVYGFPLLIIIIAGHLIEKFIRSLNQSEELNETLKDMMTSISRFVPTQFLKSLGKEKITDVALGDAILNNMTVLFMDIRNFTKLSSQMSPSENFEFLNAFLKRMEPSINKHKGFVDKYIGDAIMALFAENADEAVRAALEMRFELSVYNKIRNNANLPGIDFGVGINSGDVMLGTVGSSTRMDTTVIGHSVNLASKVEQLTKIYSTPVLITDNVYKKLIEPNHYFIRELDIIQVHGVETPVVIYEVYDCDTPEQIELKEKTFLDLQNAIKKYRDGCFSDALQIFKNCLNINPDDNLIKVYINRCTGYLAAPPSPEARAGISKFAL